MRITSLLSIASAAILLVSCKPSEKNYRLAYETAQRQAHADLDEGVYEQMQLEALPPMIHTATDSVRVQTLPLAWSFTPAMVDSGKWINPKAYNVAVALYKMPTNARAHAENLAREGYRSVVMKSGQSLFYVMAGVTESLDSAASIATEYQKQHKDGYVGISCPIAIQPAR